MPVGMSSLPDPTTLLSRLEATIAARRAGGSASGPDASYVARLHAKGRGKMAQKVGEEATEVVIAALTGAPEALVGEAADLLFHLLVLMGDCGVSLAQVTAELERREGVSGIAEKASRSS
ncbi:phosphoribosyl-ATP diphosphatase [Novosphingobium sp.]|uniref:phosphoribosyl-ATP diphosphatase n=1 Tax=Novosphingobium sp. TaxID=1874826 RepID=UPI003BAC4209